MYIERKTYEPNGTLSEVEKYNGYKYIDDNNFYIHSIDDLPSIVNFVRDLKTDKLYKRSERWFNNGVPGRVDNTKPHTIYYKQDGSIYVERY